jgi:NAD(P)H dehydrogenase (quinone)
LNAGFSVCNLVRKPQSLPARKGLSYAYLDLEIPSSYDSALKNAEILGLITPAGPNQVEQETRLIAAAAHAGVKKILKVSVIGAELPQPVSSFALSATAVEQVLGKTEVAHPILRPNFFMQQILSQRDSIEGDSMRSQADRRRSVTSTCVISRTLL